VGRKKLTRKERGPKFSEEALAPGSRGMKRIAISSDITGKEKWVWDNRYGSGGGSFRPGCNSGAVSFGAFSVGRGAGGDRIKGGGDVKGRSKWNIESGDAKGQQKDGGYERSLVQNEWGGFGRRSWGKIGKGRKRDFSKSLVYLVRVAEPLFGKNKILQKHGRDRFNSQWGGEKGLLGPHQAFEGVLYGGTSSKSFVEGQRMKQKKGREVRTRAQKKKKEF